VNGPGPQKREALRGLELIADTFLSVATPVQAALPEILALGRGIGEAIRERCRSSLERIGAAIAARGSVALLPVEGGWSAVLRIPKTGSDEEFAVGLLEQHGVLIHPGYFFDFPGDGYVVVSLLTQPDILTEGMRRMLSMIPA
jgi:aspartate/methionine/tyrosine aminotransferase